MNYRQLGKTGLLVSEIGLGCEGFIGKSEEETKEMFDLAFKYGVNCMDLYSPNPQMQQYVGKAIASRRSEFVLQAHLCTIWDKTQYKATRNIKEVKQAFEAMLENLQTDYIDIGMIHYIDSQKTWEEVLNGDVMKYALELKAQGKIKHLGMSSHNPIVSQEALKSGLIEVLMFSVNPCYDLLPGDEDCDILWDENSYNKEFTNFDPTRKALYEVCQSLEVGITVMKAFGGGNLLTDSSPAGKALTVAQCLNYALTRPAVASVMVGTHTMQELQESLDYVNASPEEKDYSKVFSEFPKISWTGHCMYCGHCAPCPKGIDVATVTKFLNLATSQKQIPETVQQHYDVLPSKASDCIGCKACEKRCPFDVEIVKNMQKAQIIFGK